MGTLPPTDELIRRIRFRDAGHGYDEFGFSPEVLGRAVDVMRPLYERYFRVTGHDAHHIPAEGGAILAANHSGPLPLDGVMLALDVMASTDPPRAPRPVGDLFIASLPFVGTLFSRLGLITGSRENFRRLLERGELVIVFPEGVPGVKKTFWKRYELQPFRVGHAELAIRHRVPVVPVAIIGAEEWWPMIARIDGVRLFGAPYLPIPATLLPLPTRLHLHYGEPILLHEDYPPEAADDPGALVEAAGRVQGAVGRLIEKGLREREGVFA